jgi:hypothetical protein
MKMDLLWRANAQAARSAWGSLDREALRSLKELTVKYRLSVSRGDLQLLSGRWYVTHTGLLGIAQRRRCCGIQTRVLDGLCDPSTHRWVFKASVFKRRGSMSFVGYGDADPSNTGVQVRGAEMRVAETRAVNRALRKAYGIGLCSVEEPGSSFSAVAPTNGRGVHATSSNGNGSPNGQPRLRDKLCLLIRKYELDPDLVKRYAADFCGTELLRDASRDLVESFVSSLAEQAATNRDALTCKLNSYGQSREVKS